MALMESSCNTFEEVEDEVEFDAVVALRDYVERDSLYRGEDMEKRLGVFDPNPVTRHALLQQRAAEFIQAIQALGQDDAACGLSQDAPNIASES